MLKHLLLTVALAACTSGSSGNPTPMDAPLTNQPFGAKCYVTSDTSTECTSGVCSNSFDKLGYDVCSQKCTMLMAMDPSCPAMSALNAMTGQICNMKGYCKP